ncbi:hypothetical protein [Pseudomonas sp. S2.OTC.A_B10]|uniref:hypothetical protein n=1 Tax=Pseudomonas sp. S2.OTC.A_B10 TaxID=3237018 RepID=UPI003CEF3B38
MQYLKRYIIKTVSIFVVAFMSSFLFGATFAPPGQFLSVNGQMVFKSPATFQSAVTCDASLYGVVDGDGVANITTVSLSGTNTLCRKVVVSLSAWSMTAVGSSNISIGNTPFSLSGFPSGPLSNCGPRTLSGFWTSLPNKLNVLNQPLAGSCTIVSLTAQFTDLHITP